ncbi:MAG: hypothetical protein MPJ50_10280 [Pirellulales bacterium]|nr:hypothetical protein [Pirellulales bacterium]
MFDRQPILIVAVLVLGCTAAPQSAIAQNKAGKVTFEDHITPIFRQHCVVCHEPNGKLGGLDLSTYQGTMEGGSSGAVIEPGVASDSYLYMLITHESEPKMPQNADKLSDADLAVIRNWIDGGVLENAGSKAKLSNKPKMEMASGSTGTRPDVMPWPKALPLQPRVVTQRASAIIAMTTNPWAPLLALGSEEQVLLYDLRSMEILGVLPFPQGTPQVLKFSANGSLLLAGGGKSASKGVVVVWNVETGEPLIEVGDELDTVLAADISADHQWVALGGPQRLIRIYSTQDGSLQHEIKKHTDWVTEIAFSPDGVLLATGDRNGGLHVWETFTARPYADLRGHSKMITGLSWRSDSNIVASASEDATVRLWEMKNGTQVKQWNAHGGGTADVEFLRDGRLVSCGRDRQVKLWDQNGGQQRKFAAFNDLALSVTYCDETNRVVAGDWTGEVRVWNGEDASQLGILAANPPSLETRLATAQQVLTQAQAGATAKQQVATAAQAAVDEKAAELQAAQNQITEAQATIQTSEADLTKSQKRAQELTTRKEQQATALRQRQEAIPHLKEAAAQMAKAVEAAAGDEALAKLGRQLRQKLDAYTQERDTLTKAVSETQSALAKVAEQAKIHTDTVTTAKATIAKATKRVAKLKPAVKAAQGTAQNAAKAQSVADTALERAKSTANRWQDAAIFQQQWDSIWTRIRTAEEESLAAAAKLAESSEAAVTAESALADINQQAATIRQAVAAADQEIAGSKMVMETSHAAIVTANQSIAKQKTSASTIDQAAAELRESLKRAQAAADTTNDENLTAVINGLKAAITAREQQVKELARQQAAAQKIIEESNAAIATAKQMGKDAQARKESATAQLEAMGEDKTAAEQQLSAAQQMVTQAEAQVQTADQAVKAARDQLATLQDSLPRAVSNTHAGG